MADDEPRDGAGRLADEMRRIIERLAVVRPPAEELRQAAEAAAVFADRLEQLPERTRSWEVSEAGLLPRDFVAYSPVSGRSNAISPPVILRPARDRTAPISKGRCVSGLPTRARPDTCTAGGWRRCSTSCSGLPSKSPASRPP
jgi:hypothetical protein